MLASIAFMNIKTRLFTYGFKNDIFNLYFNLNICCNSSSNIILALYLANFNN